MNERLAHRIRSPWTAPWKGLPKVLFIYAVAALAGPVIFTVGQINSVRPLQPSAFKHDPTTLLPLSVAHPVSRGPLHWDPGNLPSISTMVSGIEAASPSMVANVGKLMVQSTDNTDFLLSHSGNYPVLPGAVPSPTLWSNAAYEAASVSPRPVTFGKTAKNDFISPRDDRHTLLVYFLAGGILRSGMPPSKWKLRYAFSSVPTFSLEQITSDNLARLTKEGITPAVCISAICLPTIGRGVKFSLDAD